MAKDYRKLWKEVTSTTDESNAVRTLAKILVDKEGRSVISNLGRKDAELCIEILDHGIAEHELKSVEKQTFFLMLRRLAGTYGRLPESMMVTEEIEVSNQILASGGFADVRTGTYMGHLVAVKSMRVAEQDEVSKIRKQFCKEVILWNTLSHPNVLKLDGVRGDMDKGQFITVSEWMEHGNIMQYIRKTPVNRLELLHGAAQGLKYLHDANLIHGDLKGANILMSNDNPPRACLADFGFMTMVLDPGQPMSCSARLDGGTVMFMSPELLMPEKFGFAEAVPTREADIYAFGLVIYQVLTGNIPFHKRGIAEIALNAVQGMRPAKPEKASAIGFSDTLWRFVQCCWDAKLEFRPKVAGVVSQLERATADWDGVMPPCARTESPAPPEPTSDSMANCRIFQSSSSIVSESSTKSKILFPSFDPPSTSTQYTEPPSGVPQEDLTKPSNKPRAEARVHRLWPKPSVSRPRPEPSVSRRRTELLVPTPRLKEELDDDLVIVYAHLEQQHKPPPSRLPKKKRTGFIKHLRQGFCGLFHLTPAKRWPNNIRRGYLSSIHIPFQNLPLDSVNRRRIANGGGPHTDL